jgi:hypothetical protein
MAYNERLAQRVREQLQLSSNEIEEINMFGGLCFMVNQKMCAGIMKDDLMCRLNPIVAQEELERGDCREMTFTGRPMKSIVLVSNEEVSSAGKLKYWLDLCLAFNPMAKSSKGKTKVNGNASVGVLRKRDRGGQA